MQMTSEARAARKRAQLARLEAKADPDQDYVAFYASQPLQRAKATLNDKIRAAREEHRSALGALDLARATGEGLETAEARAREAGRAVEMLRALKAARFRPGSNAALAGGEQ